MKSVFWMLTLVFIVCEGVDAVDVDYVIRRAETPFMQKRMYSIQEMTIHRSGKPRPTMIVESYSLEHEGSVRSLMVYREPVRLRGTAYLIIDNELWVRFGMTGRIRKMSSSILESSAGGTDFSYSDLGESGGGLSGEYTTNLIDENAEYDGLACYQIELKPEGQSQSPYDKLVVFIARDSSQYQAIYYYKDRAHVKTLVLSDFKNVGDFPYPHRLVMESHTKDSMTEVIIKDVEIDSPRVLDEMFSTDYLETLP